MPTILLPVKPYWIELPHNEDFKEMIWREAKRHCGLLRIENLPRSERKALLLYVLNCHAQDLQSGAIVIALKKKIRIRKPRFE